MNEEIKQLRLKIKDLKKMNKKIEELYCGLETKILSGKNEEKQDTKKLNEYREQMGKIWSVIRNAEAYIKKNASTYVEGRN